MVELEFHLRDEWPPLAWLARCTPSSHIVQVWHGRQVETNTEWFCEAVWAGNYFSADFDRTDLVFGSGARQRNGTLLFVSSGTTVDRLLSCEHAKGFLVSNSLPCLLARAAATPPPSSSHFYGALGSIVHGLNRYKPVLDVGNQQVQVTFFDNLAWDGHTLRVCPKPDLRRDFSSFETYREFIDSSLRALAENLTSNARRYPYRWLGSLSSGYDSPAVTTLARGAGLREAISFTHARGGDRDDGCEVARRLGLTLTEIARDDWTRSALYPEVPFIAADAQGGDVVFRGAEKLLAGRVLLTGVHGDTMWGKDPADLSPHIVRPTRAGLSLTEYRLWAGFIHVPPAYMGVKQIADVNRISRAKDMARWDVPGSYSRPICRRIVEEAGVPRDLFGVRKKATLVLFVGRADELSASSRTDFHRWLRHHARRRSPGVLGLYVRGRLFDQFRPLNAGLQRLMRTASQRALRRMRYAFRQIADRLSGVAHTNDLMCHAFPWAVEKAQARYADTLSRTVSSGNQTSHGRG